MEKILSVSIASYNVEKFIRKALDSCCVPEIMDRLEVRFVQPQTYALYRDLKVMSGASPNQIKPIHVITDGRLKRFFFGLLQQ